ncbi:hypothetical protein YDYSY3_60380 [Paenibacillus chitinolyticus]|nr:hypothetical protein YDYSY3_60380 [Paenibacillus chitinolyticus]
MKGAVLKHRFVFLYLNFHVRIPVFEYVPNNEFGNVRSGAPFSQSFEGKGFTHQSGCIQESFTNY